MKYRKFRDTEISEIGLGTWQLGSSDWGALAEEDAFAILQTFVDGGGNFIDTADVYGSGISEKTIGAFLKTTNKPLYVATKLGRRGDGSCGWPQNFTDKSMREHVESSLQHLGQSQLFLEQLHCIPTEELRKGEVFNNFRQLQSEGLVKHWGVSVETSEEALLCLEQEGLASLQIIFNLFRQHVAEDVFAKAKEKGVALIVRVPLASGLLTGKFTETTTFPESDHRHYNRDGNAFNAGETFSGIAFSEGVQHAKMMQAMVPEGALAQWALRWILDYPEVTTVIPGASSSKQVESNLAASALPSIPQAAHQDLRTYYEQSVKPSIRGHY
ncbi:MAG: aldo/keto reductase [Chitinophagaceae bacterium]|nr:MAG: aldo/keto reductase [Chitinophagaceae bacterium]